MSGLVTEESMLGALLEETRGVVGVVLGTADGELRAVVGSVGDSNTAAAVAAALASGLQHIGSLLGLGGLAVASIKAASAARVLAQQAGAVVMIELDPKRPLGELEVRLQTMAWAPPEDDIERPSINRTPTVPVFMDPEDSTQVSARSGAPTRPTPMPGGSGIAPAMRANRSSPPPPPGTVSRSSQPPGSLARPSPPPPGSLARTTPPPMGSSTSALLRLNPATVSSQMKSIGSGPVFTGDLEEFCLPDLLELLRNSHRTGLLMCTTGAGVGTIQLSRGMIISADSPNAMDLREHFLTSPEVGPELRRVLAAMPPECFGDDMIDGELVSRELMPRGQVERARVARIFSAFREMIGWTAGRFAFDPAVPVVANPSLALSAQSILMQIYQEQDEQGR